MVEVDTGDHREGGVIKCLGTKDTGIRAHIGPDPVPGRIERIGVEGPFPSLKGDVSPPKPLVRERELDVNLVLVVIGEVAVLLESEELATGDRRRLRVRQSS